MDEAVAAARRGKQILIIEDERLDKWRRGRDSNPRYGFPYTHFPGVRLQPLGHPSASQPCSESVPL